jgi:hypothetical protein
MIFEEYAKPGTEICVHSRKQASSMDLKFVPVGNFSYTGHWQCSCLLAGITLNQQTQETINRNKNKTDGK